MTPQKHKKRQYNKLKWIYGPCPKIDAELHHRNMLIIVSLNCFFINKTSKMLILPRTKCKSMILGLLPGGTFLEY